MRSRTERKKRLDVHLRPAKKLTVLLLNPGRPFAGAGSSKYVTLVNWSCHLDVWSEALGVRPWSSVKCKFCKVAVMILDPPAAPVAILKSPVSRSSAMEDEMEDCGRFPG